MAVAGRTGAAVNDVAPAGAGGGRGVATVDPSGAVAIARSPTAGLLGASSAAPQGGEERHLQDDDQRPERPFLTTREAAELLQVAPTTVSRLAARGKIPGAFRVNGRWLFTIDEFERWTKRTTPPTKK